MRLSVVIPTLGSKPRQLGLTLAALGTQSLPCTDFEVLICDDGPEGNPAAVLARSWGRCHLSHTCRGRGAAATRNLGVRAARAPRVLFLDDDCLAEPTLLEAHADRPAGVGVIGLRNRVAEADWRDLANPFDLSSLPWSPEVRDRPRTLGYIHSVCASGHRHVQAYAFSCHLSVPTATLRRVGGFWEEMKGSGHEDRELAVRCCRAGLAFRFLEAPRVWHLDHPQCPQQGLHAAANLALLNRTLADAGVVTRNGGPS